MTVKWTYTSTVQESNLVRVLGSDLGVDLGDYGVYSVVVNEKYSVVYTVIDGKGVVAYGVIETDTDIDISKYPPLIVTEFLKQEAETFNVPFFGYKNP